MKKTFEIELDYRIGDVVTRNVGSHKHPLYKKYKVKGVDISFYSRDEYSISYSFEDFYESLFRGEDEGED